MSMPTRSIRWRLALSYAAIACLAALALGAVLLAILRNYYTGRERIYLHRNAAGFSALVASGLEQQVPMEALEPQLRNLAFFSKTRIRVHDSEGNLLFDSGLPDEPVIMTFAYSGAQPVGSTASGSGGGESISGDAVSGSFVVLQPGVTQFEGAVSTGGFTAQGDIADGADVLGTEPLVMYENLGGAGANAWRASSVMPLSSTLYGFELNADEESLVVDQEPDRRSSQQIEFPVLDSEHRLLATVLVSDGPAYGSEIVNSVARGWVLSGGIAVLLAAAAGWFVSREITRPLRILTTTTTRMSAGDLAARAEVRRRDEVGILAASFNQMADRIQETVTTLQRFVADAAHELHTPLTALRTNLELASSDTSLAALHRAHEQVIRMQRLTDDLLELSRIEGQPSASLSPVDLLAVIRPVAEVFASRAEQADIDYTVDVPAALPAVRGCADQLACVLTNLLDNALKFTDSGGAVSMAVRQGGAAVELVVQDTGIGILPDDLPLLFERFRRGHNAAAYPGSGLGLAIVQRIVAAHGGTVRAESPGTGTIITVTLPLADG